MRKPKNEQQMWKVLKPHLDKVGHFVRIESGITVLGQPDVNFCVGGKEGNIEFKYIYKGKKKPIVRPAQIAWFKKRREAGGFCCIITYVEDTNCYMYNMDFDTISSDAWAMTFTTPQEVAEYFKNEL